MPEVGTVLGGTLTRGILREGDKVLVGPREDGAFVETSVATIRRNRTPCRMVRARQAATVTLAHVERTDVRKVRTKYNNYIVIRIYFVRKNLCVINFCVTMFSFISMCAIYLPHIVNLLLKLSQKK